MNMRAEKSHCGRTDIEKETVDFRNQLISMMK